MKEIKFRLWDKEKKKMVYPSYQSRALKNQARHECLHLYPDSSCCLFDTDKEDMIFLIQPDETDRIMQFTGLKDKKGKEIFEGDIVRFYPYELSKQRHKRGLLINGRIVFNNQAQFCIRYIDMFNPDGETDYLFSKECEVIGNIYENPDLLIFDKQKEHNSG